MSPTRGEQEFLKLGYVLTYFPGAPPPGTPERARKLAREIARRTATARGRPDEESSQASDALSNASL